MRDRAISLKFSTHKVSKRCTIVNFQKKIPLPKNGGHFEFLPKVEKHNFASISLTMRNRVISSKFSTHKVSKRCAIVNFQINFPLPKNGGHFEFLPKMEKHKFKMYYWQFSKKFPLPKNGSHFEFLPKMEKHKFKMYYWQFSKKFPLPKNGGHFEFLPKMKKTPQICFYLLNRAR